MDGSSGVYFARAAFETGMISRRRLALDLFENVRYRLVGSTDERADAVRERVAEMIAGVPVRELQRLAPRVLAGVLPRLYPRCSSAPGRTRTQARRSSSSPRPRRRWPTCCATCSASTAASARARRSSTASTPAAPRARSTTARARSPRWRSSPRNSGSRSPDSYAYSDSESDLPMLRAVGHPVVVNPDAALREIATREGWEIIELDRLRARLKPRACSPGCGRRGDRGRVRARRSQTNNLPGAR